MSELPAAHLLGVVHDRLLRALEQVVDAKGWNQAPALYAVRLDGPTLETTSPLFTGLQAEPVAVLDGNPVCALLRLRPELDDAVGAVVVTEAWAYGPEAQAALAREEAPPFTPAQDPDRVELRLAQLVLADGSCHVIEHRRGAAATRRPLEGPSWLTLLLRRSLGLDSQAPPPNPDLALRLVLLWQVSNLLLLGDGGYELGALAPTGVAWGQFSIPGLGAAPGGLRDAWWAPVEAALAGGGLDVDALAAALRGQLASNPDVTECLPLAFPFERGRDAVLASAELLDWMDPELLAAFIDACVPDREVLTTGAERSLPAGLRDGMLQRLAAG